jgi:hypothetical protein
MRVVVGLLGERAPEAPPWTRSVRVEPLPDRAQDTRPPDITDPDFPATGAGRFAWPGAEVICYPR